MDFNGVIIDDESIQMRLYSEILAKDGIEMTEEKYLASLGMDDTTFVRTAFTREGKTCTPSKIDEIITAKSEKWFELCETELPLVDGIQNFVKKMSEEFCLGIVSMAPRGEIEFALEKGDMASCFSTIVSGGDVVDCKPDPACYRLGFNKVDSYRISLGRSPMTHNECLVIEDSPPGVVAARGAGLQALGVTGTVSADKLRAAGAGAVASDLRDWMPDSIRRVFN